MSRRSFLERSAQALGGVALAGPASALLSACGGKSGTDSSKLQVIPNSASNVYTFSFSDFPQLQNTGGAVLVEVSASSGSVPVAIVRTGTSAAVALDATCTHAGCVVDPYDSSAQTFTCGCHGSVFRQDGSVTNGPASSPLKSYGAQVTDSAITSTIP